MFKISVWHGELSESYLRFVTQLGVDCLDFGQGDFFPGVKEQGYPDLDKLLKIKNIFYLSDQHFLSVRSLRYY